MLTEKFIIWLVIIGFTWFVTLSMFLVKIGIDFFTSGESWMGYKDHFKESLIAGIILSILLIFALMYFFTIKI